MNTSFTYSSEDISTPLAQLRLSIGDTDPKSGARPDGRNYSDAELQFFLTGAGNVLNLAIAIALGALATEYATASRRMFAKADAESVTSARAFADIARSLREQATTWRSIVAAEEVDDEQSGSDGVAYGGTDVKDAFFGLPPSWIMR